MAGSTLVIVNFEMMDRRLQRDLAAVLKAQADRIARRDGLAAERGIAPADLPGSRNEDPRASARRPPFGLGVIADDKALADRLLRLLQEGRKARMYCSINKTNDMNISSDLSIRAAGQPIFAQRKPVHPSNVVRPTQNRAGEIHRALLGVLMLFAATGAALAAPADDMAKRISDAVGRPAGLIHLPRGDGALACALATQYPNAVVHVQAADPAAIRRHVDTAGLLGRRVFVDQGDLNRLLPVGRSCDLVVLWDLTSADLTGAAAAEIRRVLHPWFGVAVFSPATPAVRTWAREIGEVTEDGGLLLARGKPLPGADDWPMWWHGPDNNAVSTDTAFGRPETLQWTGKPFFSDRVELPVISNGRLFTLWNGSMLDSSPGLPKLTGVQGDGPLVTCHSSGSGVVLWARALSAAAWRQLSRSTMVAQGNSLFVADGPLILELEQATGRELRRKQLDTGEIRWLAPVADRLLVMGGPKTEMHKFRSVEQVTAFRTAGLDLRALRLSDFGEAWRVNRSPGPEAFDPRSPAVAAGKVFTCTEGGTAEAFAVADGKSVWRAATKITRSRWEIYQWDRSSRHPVTGYAMAGLYIVATGPEMDACAVLAQADGQVAWELPRGRGVVGPIPLTFDNLIWFGAQGTDPLTGAQQKDLGHLAGGGCSRLTASPQGILGTCGLVWDRATSELNDKLPAKSSCGAGSLVANGLIWKFTTPCSGCTEWRGIIVRGKQESVTATPRVMGAGQALPGKSAEGWLKHRADARRSCAMPVHLPATARILWTKPAARTSGRIAKEKELLLEPEIVPSPPVVAGNLAMIAGGDGTVDAIKLNSGESVWRAYTGGRIYSAPMVYQDRVFVGSADGYVYALALATGTELWRARVAPESGRVMIYGQMGSRWPVLGSPLVVDGRVIATAGMLEGIDGIVAAAFDPSSGKLLWENHDWNAAGVDGLLSGAGQLCAAEGAGDIIFHGGEAPLVRLSLKDGTPRAVMKLPDAEEIKRQKWSARGIEGIYRCAKGQDAGVLGDEWLVFGGRRMFIDQVETGTWRNFLSFMRRDGRRPVLQATDAVILPAWDDEDVFFVLAGRQNDAIAMVPREGLLKALAAGADTSVVGQIQVGGVDPLRWRQELAYRVRVAAAALTSNAALLMTRDKEAGKLIVLNRQDGSALWEIPLPATPCYDGLAIATDGSIILTLVNGQTLCVGPERK